MDNQDKVTMKHGITKNGVHYWDSTNMIKNGVNLDIPGHGFKSFANVDNAINWLYLNDFKPCARELNAVKKGYGEIYNKNT